LSELNYKSSECTGGLRHDFYSPPGIRMVKSRRVRVGHARGMGEKNAYMLLLGRPIRKSKEQISKH
jgi:hypothetical protein